VLIHTLFTGAALVNERFRKLSTGVKIVFRRKTFSGPSPKIFVHVVENPGAIPRSGAG
jgi:hypothetical protein